MQSAEHFIEQALSPRAGAVSAHDAEGTKAAAGASQDSPTALGQVLAILSDHSEQLRRLWGEHAELAAEHRRLRERVDGAAAAPPQPPPGGAGGARSRSVSPIGSIAPPGAAGAPAAGTRAAAAHEGAGRPGAPSQRRASASGKTPPPQRRGSTPPPGKAATTTVWFGSKPGGAQPVGATPKAEAQRPAVAASRRSLTPPGTRGSAAPAGAPRTPAAAPGAAAAAAPRSPTPPAAARGAATASASRRSTTPPAAADAARRAARGSTPPAATRIPAAAARKPSSAGAEPPGGSAKPAARSGAPAEGDAPPEAASGKQPGEAVALKRRSAWGAKVGAKAAGAGPNLFELARPLLEASTPPEARTEALGGVARALERGAATGSWQGPGTPMRAAVQGRATDLVQALLKARADANESDDKGVSLLHVASFDGAPELCGALLEAGACANAKDRHGQTPLFFAPSGEVCELLHRHGAECDQTNQKGQLALHLAGRAGLSDVLAWLAEPGHMPQPMLEQKDVHGATAAYYAHHAGVPKEFLMRHRLLSLESPESPGHRGGHRASGGTLGGLQRLPQLPEGEDEDAESPPGTARRLRPSIGGGPDADEEEEAARDARQQQLRHQAAVCIQAVVRAALRRRHPRGGAGRPDGVPLLVLPKSGGPAAPPREPAKAAGSDAAPPREKRTWGSRSRAQRAGADAAAGARAEPAAPAQAWEEPPLRPDMAAGPAEPAGATSPPAPQQGPEHLAAALAEVATVLQAAWRGRVARRRASAERLRRRVGQQAQDPGVARRPSRESAGSCRLSVSDMVTWEAGDEAELGQDDIHTPASSEFSENPSSPSLDDSKDRRKQRRSRISESQGYLR